MKNLKELLVHQIKDLYSAEKQLLETMPKMEAAANASKLKKAFGDHYKQTQEHLDVLQTICDDMDINPGNKKCKAMAGLVKEGEHMVKAKADPDVKDAGLIAAAQRIEHYEISGYGTARHYAEALKLKDVESRLKKILSQEQKCDTHLNKLAIDSINKKAMR